MTNLNENVIVNGERWKTDRGKLPIQGVAGIAEAQLKADWSVSNPKLICLGNSI